MAQLTFKGNPVATVGQLPQVGAPAPGFTLVKADLSEAVLQDYAGKTLILNIFPSLDTGTCALSVKRFNQEAAGLNNTAVLCVSADLPFAAKRFCATEGIEHASTGSVFRSPEFGRDYGVTITEGPLKGLLSRAVVIVDAAGSVVYTEQVGEITEEPNYEAALKVARGM